MRYHYHIAWKTHTTPVYEGHLFVDMAQKINSFNSGDVVKNISQEVSNHYGLDFSNSFMITSITLLDETDETEAPA